MALTILYIKTVIQVIFGRVVPAAIDLGALFFYWFRLATLIPKFEWGSITHIFVTHGELVLKLGPFSKTIKPGPGERVGWGAIGFEIELDGKKIVNLGDTLLRKKEWQRINKPDVLMIPIGGKAAHNTMVLPSIRVE